MSSVIVLTMPTATYADNHYVFVALDVDAEVTKVVREHGIFADRLVITVDVTNRDTETLYLDLGIVAKTTDETLTKNDCSGTDFARVSPGQTKEFVGCYVVHTNSGLMGIDVVGYGPSFAYSEYGLHTLPFVTGWCEDLWDDASCQPMQPISHLTQHVYPEGECRIPSYHTDATATTSGIMPPSFDFEIVKVTPPPAFDYDFEINVVEIEVDPPPLGIFNLTLANLTVVEVAEDVTPPTTTDMPPPKPQNIPVIANGTYNINTKELLLVFDMPVTLADGWQEHIQIVTADYSVNGLSSLTHVITVSDNMVRLYLAYDDYQHLINVDDIFVLLDEGVVLGTEHNLPNNSGAIQVKQVGIS